MALMLMAIGFINIPKINLGALKIMGFCTEGIIPLMIRSIIVNYKRYGECNMLVLIWCIYLKANSLMVHITEVVIRLIIVESPHSIRIGNYK